MEDSGIERVFIAKVNNKRNLKKYGWKILRCRAQCGGIEIYTFSLYWRSHCCTIQYRKSHYGRVQQYWRTLIWATVCLHVRWFSTEDLSVVSFTIKRLVFQASVMTNQWNEFNAEGWHGQKIRYCKVKYCSAERPVAARLQVFFFFKSVWYSLNLQSSVLEGSMV